MEDVVVSIACLAFNHEKYIRQTIESFLSQKTQYSYEIIINDDASTDGTSEIIKEYEERYPQIVKGIFHEENQYTKKECFIVRDLYKECKGKYIAFCEGDDFWLDNNKLQIQIEYLESHPECIMTAHNAIVLDCLTGNIFSKNSYEDEGFLDSKEIILQQNGNLPTASLVFRREATMFEDFFLESGVGDWPIQLYSITKGKIYYFDRIMSVYRYNHENSWSRNNLDKSDKQCIHAIRMIHFLKRYNEYTNLKYKQYIVGRMQEYVSNIIYAYEDIDINIGVSLIENLGKKDNYFYLSYLSEIKRIYQQVFDMNYCNNQLCDFVKENQHVVIWGIGKYGSVLAKQMERANLDYDGFAVSDREIIPKLFYNKPVWQINKIPFEKENLGIVIAINPTQWYILKSTLENENIFSYYCPYLFNWENN